MHMTYLERRIFKGYSSILGFLVSFYHKPDAEGDAEDKGIQDIEATTIIVI